MARTSTTLVVASLLVLTATVGAVPGLATAGPSDKLSPPTAEVAGLVTADTSSAVTYGSERYPSVHVYIAENKSASLASWAGASTERSVNRWHNESQYALVSAPVSHLGLRGIDRLAGTPLVERGYVETMALNRDREFTSPATLRNKSSVGTPEIGLLGVDDPSYPDDGVAYGDEADPATTGEAARVTGANAVASQGDNVTVAVIDSGVNAAGGNLYGNGTENATGPTRLLPASKDFVGGGTGVEAVEDPNGHGSWVAARVAANHTTDDTLDGMAPRADILALRALNANGSGSSANIAAAIRYAADHANTSSQPVILQMSLGAPVYDEALVRAIDYAYEQGVAGIVVAAGNSRVTGQPWVATPADADGPVISVAASNTSTADTAQVAYFSQLGNDPGTTDFSAGATRGENVTVTAPGMAQVAPLADVDGVTNPAQLSGTSMAAPTVSGGLAQVLATNPSWGSNATRVHDRVTDTAAPMPHAAPVEAGAGLFRADYLNESRSQESQAAVANEQAQARQTFWEAAAADAGGLFGVSFEQDATA